MNAIDPLFLNAFEALLNHVQLRLSLANVFPHKKNKS
jgi:hypothetical protein